MKEYTIYSESQRYKIVSDIPKDKDKINRLWDKATYNYELSKTSIGEKKLEYNNLQRKYRNKIMNYALEDYHSKDKKNDKRNSLIANSFSEFWDFLGFWLDDVLGKEEAKKWNEMENYFHKIK